MADRFFRSCSQSYTVLLLGSGTCAWEVTVWSAVSSCPTWVTAPIALYGEAPYGDSICKRCPTIAVPVLPLTRERREVVGKEGLKAGPGGGRQRRRASVRVLCVWVSTRLWQEACSCTMISYPCTRGRVPRRARKDDYWG